VIRPLAALAAVFCALASPAAPADTLLDNIQGSTIDAAGKLAHFNGLLIDRDGRITAVLARNDKRPRKPDYLIDGKGRFVLPGMIDSHVRLMPMALTLLASDKADMPPPRPEDRDVAFGKVQRLLAAQGITAVADMGTSIEDWQTYRRAGDNGTLYLRIMAYAGEIPAMALMAGPRPTPWLYEDRLRMGGLHLALDGPTDDIRLRNILSRAAMDGFQLSLSARTPAAVTTALGAYAELSATYQGERRWRLEQVRIANPGEFTAYASNAILSLAPSRLAEDRAAPDATDASRVQPWQSLAAAKLRLVFGSGDGAAARSPLGQLAAAMSREDGKGEPPGGWQPQERLSREQALAALTADAAHAGFAEGRFGRLATGERADFIVLDQDPLLASPAQLRTARVLETWIGGRKIYDAAMAAQAPSGPGQSIRTSAEDAAPARLVVQPAPPPAPAYPASR
jgi:predicted amidohydrolase YtcJ